MFVIIILIFENNFKKCLCCDFSKTGNGECTWLVVVRLIATQLVTLYTIHQNGPKNWINFCKNVDKKLVFSIQISLIENCSIWKICEWKMFNVWEI